MEHICRVVQMEGRELLAQLRGNPRLLRAMSYPSVFCAQTWLEAVLQHGNAREPLAFTVYREDSVIALLPLEKVRNRLGGYDFRYLGHRFHPDPVGVICAENDRAEVISALAGYVRKLPEWDRLILDYLLPEEAALWPGESQPQATAPYLVLPQSFDELLNSFNGKKRYKLRAKLRRAEAAHLEFTHAKSELEKAHFLDALFDLHDRRSLAIGRVSSLRHKQVRAVHAQVVNSGPEAWLFSLKHEGRFVAVTYGFMAYERFFFYQVAHDPAYNDLRPGTVILAKTIACVCELGASEFNFLQGAEDYKFEWTSDTRSLMQVRVIAPRFRAKLLNQADNAVVHLRRAARMLRAGRIAD